MGKYFHFIASVIFGVIFYFDYTYSLDAWTWLWLAQAIVYFMVYQIYVILENVAGSYTKIKELHETTGTKKSGFKQMLDDQLASAQQQRKDLKDKK